MELSTQEINWIRLALEVETTNAIRCTLSGQPEEVRRDNERNSIILSRLLDAVKNAESIHITPGVKR